MSVEIILTFHWSKMHEGNIKEEHERGQYDEDDPVPIAKSDAKIARSMSAVSDVSLFGQGNVQGRVHCRRLRLV
jgi:hypothetical protein